MQIFYHLSLKMKNKFKNKTKIRVRYSETDQMGYCYYGNYAQYLEVGRVETLRELGMSYKALEHQGVMLPVFRLELDYLLPAKYDDEIEIETEMVALTGPKITFQYHLFIEGQLIAKAITSLVFVDKNSMRPIRPPEKFITLLAEF